MFKNVVLSFGYIEGLSAAQIIFSRDPYVDGKLEFESEKEILADLAEDLLTIFKENHVPEPATRKCCKKNLGKKGINFCPICGKNLMDAGKIYRDDFREFILKLRTQECDGFSYEYEPRWTPFTSPLGLTHKNTVIVEKAEDKLCELVKGQLS